MTRRTRALLTISRTSAIAFGSWSRLFSSTSDHNFTNGFVAFSKLVRILVSWVSHTLSYLLLAKSDMNFGGEAPECQALDAPCVQPSSVQMTASSKVNYN